jgi:hypothetical protein
MRKLANGSTAFRCASSQSLAGRLNLTDPQKAALKDLTDASTTADASAKKSLCADKPALADEYDRRSRAEKLAA